MRKFLTIGCVIAMLLGLGSAGDCRVCAESPSGEGEQRVPMPTLGGKQFWADELFFGQWRIQRSALSGSYRLLDESDFCHATGTFATCEEVLQRIRKQQRLRPMHGSVVLVLHGLFRTRASMNSLCAYLRRYGRYQVLNVEYPSTQAGVEEHAKSLASIVEHLEGIDKVHFVGHSLGNIVIRRYLADRKEAGAEHEGGPDVGRLVMVGPPNNGAILATSVAAEPLFRALAGEAGQELGPRWPWLAGTLGTPPCEFGIIAGGLGNERGFNPLLGQDNDGVVTVESTRLDGAKDFVVVPMIHSGLIEDPRVFQQTLLFLKQGHFRKPSE